MGNAAVLSTAPPSRESSSRFCTFLSQDKKILFAIVGISTLVVAAISSWIGVSLTSKSYSFGTYDEKLSFFHVPVESALNYSVDPCEDFYEFSCGSWPSYVSRYTEGNFITPFSLLQNSVNVRAKAIFQSSKVSSKQPEIVNHALTFYETCLKSALSRSKISHKALLKFFRKVGGFPLLQRNNWNEANFDWPKSVGLILRWLGIDTFVSAQVGVDETNATRNILMLKPPDPAHIIFDEQTVKIILYCIVSTLANSDPPNEAEFYTQVEDLYVMEKKLIEISRHYNNSAEPIRMTIEELQKEVPEVDWLTFIQTFTNDTLCKVKCFSADETILVSDILYLKTVTYLLNAENTSNKTIANLLGWYVIKELSSFMPSAIRKYAKHFGFTENENVEVMTNKCYDKTIDMFGDASSYLYIHNTPSFNRTHFEELMNYLKETFQESVESSKWLDATTKKRILNKLEVMCEVIGYSQLFMEKKAIDSYYTEFPTLTSDNIENILNVWRYFVGLNLNLLREKNVRGTWSPPRAVTHVGAYYVVDRNVIVLPMATQYPPFFYPEGPWFLSFGAMGSMIGHEINHGYDLIGRKRDKIGTITSWWTNEAIAEHNKRLLCFEHQFENYFIEGTDIVVDGTRTLSENVADTTGLEQAYIAYKKWEKVNGKEIHYAELEDFTADQMFFLGFASQYCVSMSHRAKIALAAVDPHSPARLRVVGSVSNSESFAKAFNCKLGSPMNPVKKCHIW